MKTTAPGAAPGADAPPPAATPAPAPRPIRPDELPAQRTNAGGWAILPRTFDEIWRIAALFAKAGEMVPEIYRGKPEACATAIMWGMELGVSPIQAMQGIAVIRGRASVWGDLLLALVKMHPDFVSIKEEPLYDVAPAANGQPEKRAINGYRCTVVRRDEPEPTVREFMLTDAKTAGLYPGDDKSAWRKYPARMCMMRARSWACRDTFPDAIKGLASADEMQDVIEGEARHVPREEAAHDDIPPPRELPAIEHQANPLAATMAAQIREKTPDLAALHADAPASAEHVSFADLDDLGPIGATLEYSPPLQTAAGNMEGRAGESGGGELFPPRGQPLSTGGRKLLDVYLAEAAPFGIVEQNVVDELGDNVHTGNLAEAQEILTRWIAQKGMK